MAVESQIWIQFPDPSWYDPDLLHNGASDHAAAFLGIFALEFRAAESLLTNTRIHVISMAFTGCPSELKAA